MRKRLVVVLLAVLLDTFFFVPLGKTISANFSGEGSDYVGWVSPSYAFFQCGVAIGNYPIQLPNGGTVVGASGPKPFWSSFWNCEYPHF
jgi:hypothetical protein